MGVIGIIIFGTIALATPLIAAALGGLFSERSGVVNIGLEGMMTAGAFGAGAVISMMDINGMSGTLAIVVGVVVAMLLGAIFGLLHAWLSISYKVDQVISGTVINMAALAIFVYITKIMFGAAQTKTIMSRTIKVFGNVTVISIIIIILTIVAFFVLYKTKWGKHVLAVGENPSAADAMGINVAKVRYQAVILSGALGGLGGAAIVLNSTNNFSALTVAGSGFIALAVLIFGRHNPFGILVAGIVFGFFKTLGTSISTIDPNLMPNFMRFLSDIPQAFYQMLPYIITIIVLIIFSRNKSTTIEALGIPYDKEVR